MLTKRSVSESPEDDLEKVFVVVIKHCSCMLENNIKSFACDR